MEANDGDDSLLDFTLRSRDDYNTGVRNLETKAQDHNKNENLEVNFREGEAYLKYYGKTFNSDEEVVKTFADTIYSRRDSKLKITRIKNNVTRVRRNPLLTRHTIQFVCMYGKFDRVRGKGLERKGL